MSMKLVSIFAASTAAAALLTPTASYALANSSALVMKDFGCTLPGSLVGLPVNLTGNGTIFVSTSGGESKLACHFDIPEGLEPDRVTKTSGFKCRLNGDITTNTRAHATPGGKAFLSCQN